MKKSLFLASLSGLLLATSVSAFGLFSTDITTKIEENKILIKKYEAAIKKLQDENVYMIDEKKKHPELYVQKPLFEENDKEYIYRIKLNGAKAEALSFVIKDHMVSVNMDMKQEKKSDQGYYYSSRYFSTSYGVPDDVLEDKIEHKVDGDYFVIEMPKK